ncbi:MAG: hypothetical protein NW215_12930 [Hyphomicrobiales bacterium]|nr:hypothetical protein [Hyphomicrobiales bacterium]
MKKYIGMAAAAALVALASPTFAQEKPRGKSGLLTGVTKLKPITLSVGKPLVEEPYEIEAGKYYRVEIVSDGSGELAIRGPEFFRNVWVNEVVINDIEIRPLGVDSIEFDAAGTARISFIPIRPGTFVLQIPNTTADSQKAVFNVK